MPCRESIFSRGNYFHVFCRGNEKRNIFLKAADYERFLSKMIEYKSLHKVSVICYCFMPNHFHLLLKQNTSEPVSLFMHRLTVSYSMYFNKRYDRIGHLFQGRFKAKLIKNDEYLLHLSRYIHLNPVDIIDQKARLEDYPWSSYAEYININTRRICESTIILDQFYNVDPVQSYKKFVSNTNHDTESSKIKDLTIELE